MTEVISKSDSPYAYSTWAGKQYETRRDAISAIKERRVNFLSNFHKGIYLVETVDTLKRMVNARLQRIILWDDYEIDVDGRLVSDDYIFSYDDAMVKVYERGFYTSGEEQNLEVRPDAVIQRPFLNPSLVKPEIASMTVGTTYVGTYSCSKCGAPLLRGLENCLYCAHLLNWSKVS